jgi:hypothetical protein
MAERKLVKHIQNMIDQTDERRNLGRVQLERASHFNINRPTLSDVDPDYDPSGRRRDTGSKEVVPKFIEWNYQAFNHDRGKYFSPTPLNWKVGPRHEQKRGVFNSDSRGNFLKSINLGNNLNVKFHCIINVSAEVTHKIRIETSGQSSVGVYIKKVGALNHVKQYTSGYNSPHNPTTAVPLHFSEAGQYIVTIFTYQQDQTLSVGGMRTILSGDLSAIVAGPAASGPPEVVVKFNTSAGGGTPSGGKSEFVDGANGPTLANIIFWDRIKQDAIDEAATGLEIAGYRLLNIRFETLDYQVVSGWGTDGFMVTGEKSSDFPVGLDFRTWSGLSWDDHRVSGTFYFDSTETASGNVETLIVTSGSGGASAGEFIQVEQSLFIQDIPYDSHTGPVVSGTHFGVKAGEEYKYEVQLYDRAGNIFPRSQQISFTSGNDITAPSKLTGVTATGGNKRIHLSWVNSADQDVKGINVWDTDNPSVDTDNPVKTILKGSVSEALVTGTYISQLSDRTELIDDTSYTFYLSTFDWAGNETLTSLPSDSASTTISITTQQSGKRVEMDSTNNEFRYYNADDVLTARLGENVNDSGVASRGGVRVTDGLIYVDKTISSAITSPNAFFSPMYSVSTVNEDVELASFAAAITGYKDLQYDQTIDRIWAGIEGIADNSVGGGIDTGTTLAAIYGRTAGTHVDNVVYAGYFEGDVHIEGGDLSVGGGNLGQMEPFYLRGTALNNTANRQFKVGKTTHVDGVGRGLYLAVINRSDYSLSSESVHDTYGSSAECLTLAAALNAMTKDQIGFLCSYDAWEAEASQSDDLLQAFNRLGLTHAANVPNTSRYPYAAVFEGHDHTGYSFNSSRAIEVIQPSNESGAPNRDAHYAEISGWLINGSVSAGQGSLPNSLGKVLGNGTALHVDKSNHVVISGNNNMLLGTQQTQEKLTIGEAGTNHKIALNFDNGTQGLLFEAGSSAASVIRFDADQLNIYSRDLASNMIQFDGANSRIEVLQPLYNGTSGGIDVDVGQVAGDCLRIRSDNSTANQGGLLHHQESIYAWQQVAQSTGTVADAWMGFHCVNRTAPATKQKSNVLTMFGDGSVGIGTNSPAISANGIHIDMDGGTVPALSSNVGLIINNSSAAGDDVELTLLSGASGWGQINFGDTADQDIANLHYRHAENNFHFRLGGSDTSPVATWDFTTNRLYMNSPSVTPSFEAFVVADHRNSSDPSYAAKDSTNIAHGMTAVAETDTYFYVAKISSTDGGAVIGGLSESTANQAMEIRGIAGTEDTATSTAASSPVTLNGAKKSGTGTQAIGSTGNIMTVENNGTTRVIFKGNGDVDADGTVTSGAFDLAEYMEAEEEVQGAVPIGLNLETGKVREYQDGDILVGIHSLNPAFVGNKGLDKDLTGQVLVGLVGQFEGVKEVHSADNIVYTKDKKWQVGYQLANGRVLLKIVDLRLTRTEYSIH